MEVNLYGRSQAHCDLLDEIAKVAGTDAVVLIVGPSGVGKELYARYVHEKSRRAEGPFIAVNCGSFSEDLLDNELFGHVRGAFTGAYTGSRGLVVEAEGGTLFLDEVDTFRPYNQVKLLRFLENMEYRPLGDTRVRQANVRIIAASNANLDDLVQQGQFRKDLFFRLRVAPFTVPPLNERPEDVEILISTYVDYYAEKHNLPAVKFAKPTYNKLMSYSWPGNVRELVNCVHYLTLLNLGRPVEPWDLNLLSWNEDDRTAGREIVPFGAAKQKLVRDFEHDYLHEALRQTGGNIKKAAELCGKDRRAIFELLRKHGIDAKSYRAAAKPKRNGNNVKRSGGVRNAREPTSS